MLDSGARGCLKVNNTICSWVNWKPAIEFGNPILECVYRNNTENMPCRSVAKEDVDECNDLESFSQAHGVGKNATKSSGGLEARLRLHNVVIEKPDPTNLHRGKMRQGDVTLASTPGHVGGGRKSVFPPQCGEAMRLYLHPHPCNYHYATPPCLT